MKRRWVQKKIDSLDPETEYNEIMKLVANYRLNYMGINLTTIVSLAGANLPPDGPETLLSTRKMVHRSEARFNDSNRFFLTWFFNGTDSEEFKVSVEKLNRWHLALAKTYPSVFSRNEDFVYTICSLGVFTPRLREALGLRPQSPNLDIAWHHFLRDVADNMRGLAGPVVDFPEDFAGMRRFVEEFEARNWPQTDAGKYLMHWVVQDFTDRFFPRPLHWFGRNLALLVTPEAVRRAHRMGDPGVVTGRIVKAVFGNFMRLQEKVLPDPRVPFSAIYGSAEDKQAAARRGAKMKSIHDQRERAGAYSAEPSLCPVVHVPASASE